MGHEDRLEGIQEIIAYMDISECEFYRIHSKAMKPYLLTRKNAIRRKKKYRIYTFKDLVRAYLLEYEIKKAKEQK